MNAKVKGCLMDCDLFDSTCVTLNTLRTGDADLHFYITTVQDG